jgi:spore germination protein GerM
VRSAPVRVALALLALTVLGVAGWWATGQLRAPARTLLPVDTTQVSVRAWTLWFADAQGDRLVDEARELVEVEGVHATVAALVEALAAGPTGPGVATVPAATRLLQVYREDDLLTLDLSRDFVQGLAPGSRTEEMAVGSVVRTIAAAVPGVMRVRIACGGAPITSAGGHLPLDAPLDPRDWP